MAKMIVLMCTAYFVCNVGSVFRMLDGRLVYKEIILEYVKVVYYLQFSLNFAIYAASNKQYRE